MTVPAQAGLSVQHDNYLRWTTKKHS